MNLTIDISKHPINNNKRQIELQVLILSNDADGYEVRLLCTAYELDTNDDKILASAKLFTPTTIGEYVDATGKKKDKNDAGAIEKKNYYETKKRGGTKSDLENIIDTWIDEVVELDKAGYFITLTGGL